MTSIQLFACIGMVTGFFILLRLSPMEFTDGVFRSLTSRPKSLKDEINELTHRKRNHSCAVRLPTPRTSSK